jgi:hypothetical protein
MFGAGPRDRVYYRNQKSKTIQIIGTPAVPSVTRVPIDIGRFFTAAEVSTAGRSSSGQILPALSAEDPIGEIVRVGLIEY